MHTIRSCHRALLAFALVFPLECLAHGDSNEFEGCRILLGGNPVRFSIRQPQFDPSVSYCAAVPKSGESVLEFRYEGVGQSTLKVEFELNKEPEGRTLFKQAGRPYPSGTASFTLHLVEPGDYLGHVAITDAGGNKIDSHVSFSVAKPRIPGSWKAQGVLGITVLAMLYLTYLSSATVQSLVRRLVRGTSG